MYYRRFILTMVTCHRKGKVSQICIYIYIEENTKMRFFEPPFDMLMCLFRYTFFPGPDSDRIYDEDGYEYLAQNFPNIDYIDRCYIIDEVESIAEEL